MKSLIIKDYKDVIKECFATDNSLIEVYHINAGEGLDSCVNRTHDDIKNVDVEFHKVTSGGAVVGFFGVEHCDNFKALTGFFIKPEFRKNKTTFWSLIEAAMDGKMFLCGVYDKNTRAINFLNTMGGEPVLTINEATFYRMGK